MTDRVDLAIIGGGIVGLATALRLTESRPDLRVAILEKEHELATHQSGHNSGVLHAGLYYAQGSLKARLCRQGKAELEAYAEAHGIPVRYPGKLVVALTEDELPRLADIKTRATANGVEGLEEIGPERIRELEPQGRRDPRAVVAADRDHRLPGPRARLCRRPARPRGRDPHRSARHGHRPAL